MLPFKAPVSWLLEERVSMTKVSKSVVPRAK